MLPGARRWRFERLPIDRLNLLTLSGEGKR
jgi:hypothetical protein